MSLKKRGKVYWSRVKRDGIMQWQRSTGTSDFRAATKIEDGWIKEFAMRRAGVGTAPTLAMYGEQFLSHLELHHGDKPKTLAYYRGNWATLVKYLGDVRLDKISGGDVQRFAKARLDEGVGASAVNGGIRTLRKALNLAETTFHLITRAPRISAITGEKSREAVISPEQLARLCDIARAGYVGNPTADGTGLTVASESDTDHYPDYVGPTGPQPVDGWALMVLVLPFLCDTGLRAGELVNVRWEDVGLMGQGSIFVRDGKSKAARRTIPLTPRAKSILAQLAVVKRKDGRVFGHTVGYFSHRMTKLVKAAKLAGGYCLHSTRHSFCTNLGAKGVSPYVLCKLAGHSDIKMSARYCHADREQLDAAIALLA
jgi:site-specific recombinase XerD